MAGGLSDATSGGYACSTSSKQATAKVELEKGAALHKKGLLSAAAVHYGAALDALDIPWNIADSSEGLKQVSKDATTSDALHWLGALHVQQLTKECGDAGEDEEEDAPQDAPVSPASKPTSKQQLTPEKIEEVQRWLPLLRAAVNALPVDSDAGKHSRALNSLGTALLLLGPPGLDEAMSVLHQAMRLAPTSWPVRSNMVKALRCKEKIANSDAVEREIAESLEQMAKLRPNHPGIMYRLGMALKNTGRTEEAIKALQSHLKSADTFLESDFPSRKNAAARHMLATMTGDNTATAPPEYVAALFDSYANHFEEHLVGKLQYNTPSLIAVDIHKLGISVASWRRAADLGCGTGLMCPPLRVLGFEGQLEGVDLSEKMLIQALKKGGPSTGYARLLCGDLLDIFSPMPEVLPESVVRVEHSSEKAPESIEASPNKESLFDLVVAADVFVYIGDLDPAFERVVQWLTPGGIFTFSTETHDDQGDVCYKLNDTGRYTHAPSYILKLANTHRLEIFSSRAVVLRMNGGKPVNGHVHVLRLPS